MTVGIIVGIYVIAILLGLVKPRLAILFFLPLSYCYPTWLLYNLLPLNAGLDDVLIISLFIGSLIRYGGRLEVKWPFLMALLFWVIFVFGDLSSVATAGMSFSKVWQQWFKTSGLVLFVFCVSAVVKTPEEIRRLIYSLLFGAFIGGACVIYYTANPYAYNPFQVPLWTMGLGWWAKQSIGPFLDTTIAAGVLGFTVLIGYFHIRFSSNWYRRPVLLVVTAVSFFGLLLANARSGWLFVLFPLLVSNLLSKQKIVGLLMIGLLTLVIFASFSYFIIFSDRIDLTVTQMTGGDVQSVTSNRWLIWVNHLANPKFTWLFCGEGFAIMGGAHTHNNYVGILMNMGLMGVLFWSVYYVKVMKKCSWLKRYDPDPDMAILFQSVFWCYIGYFVYFLPATPVMWPQVRYVDFFLMTLICLRYKQIENEIAYAYEEDLYEVEQDSDMNY
jgi:hypothetical protein